MNKETIRDYTKTSQDKFNWAHQARENSAAKRAGGELGGRLPIDISWNKAAFVGLGATAAALVIAGVASGHGHAEHGLDSGSEVPTKDSSNYDNLIPTQESVQVGTGAYDPSTNTLTIPNQPNEQELYPEGR